MVSQKIVGSSGWWLEVLGQKLQERQEELRLYDDYFEGKHRTPLPATRSRIEFSRLLVDTSVNFCALVVDAKGERLDVEGFRFGDQVGDKDAWKIWQANGLDAESELAHTEALVKSHAYALVEPNGSEIPAITVEDPLEVIVATAAGNRRKRLAALKRWHDESGFIYCTLYLPDRIEKYQSETKVDPDTSGLVAIEESVKWVARDGLPKSEQWPLKNPLGDVPIVPLVNRPRLSKPPRSEIKDVISSQDHINKLVIDMAVGSDFAAVRKMWATGIEIPTDPETNQPLMPLKSFWDRILTSENENAKFGEFQQSDLRPFVQALEFHIQAISSISATPPHYLLGQSGQFPSGESLTAAEAGLVSKVNRKKRPFGEGWEAVMRLAFRAMGDDRADDVTAETIWADSERRNEAQLLDSLSKKRKLGVPLAQLWEDAGYSQTQILRFPDMRKDEPSIDDDGNEDEGNDNSTT